MTWSLFVATTLLCSSVVRAQEGVIYVPGSKAGPIIQKGGPLAANKDLSIASFRRTTHGEVEVHDHVTDTFYIIDGEATLVVGGTMVGGKTTTPGQQRGTSITGGQTYHLEKGDVMVIPAGLPHWFKEVPRLIIYYTVKVSKT